jgi:hypothetical protein
VLRTSARRLSQAELAARILAAPSFVADRVPGDELDQMCAGYEAITGVRITTQKKRAFVAAVYRTLGSHFLRAVKDRFSETGTETNLLADLRSGRVADTRAVEAELNSALSTEDRQDPDAPRRAPVSPDPKEADATEETPCWGDCGCAEADLLPGLIFCAAHRPPFDPTSRRRYDRRPSNPDAARFFAAMNGPAFTGALTQ